MANEIQTVTFSPAPAAGTFTLTFCGQTTAPLDFNAAASEIQAALEALGSIGTGNTLVAGTADSGEITLTFQGALANANVLQATCDASGLSGPGTISQPTEATAGMAAVDGGSVSIAESVGGVGDDPGSDATAEAWLITGPSSMSPIGGNWTFGGADEGLAESASWGSGIVGSGQAAPTADTSGLLMDDGLGYGETMPWDGTAGVSFTDGTDTVPGCQEQQVVTVISTVGSYSLNWQAVAWNASAADVQAALDTALGMGTVTVSGPDGGPWAITWNTDGPQALLTVDGTNLNQPPISEVQSIPQPGASGGTFTVTGAAEPTGLMAFNISVADLQTALNLLSDISAAGGVTVGGADGGPWIVTWNSAGPQPLLTTDGSALTQTPVADAETTTPGGNPVGGVFWSPIIRSARGAA
jgi:hypothetical protein